MNTNEYEVISHNNINFHIFIVNLLYRTPHIHKDFEISLVLNGSTTLITSAGSFFLRENDIFIMNPYASHEIKCTDFALILSLQISPLFFSCYFPDIDNIEFDLPLLRAADQKTDCHKIREILFDLAFTYFQQDKFASLYCAVLINQLFLHLLKTQKHHIIPQKKRLPISLKGSV